MEATIKAVIDRRRAAREGQRLSHMIVRQLGNLLDSGELAGQAAEKYQAWGWSMS